MRNPLALFSPRASLSSPSITKMMAEMESDLDRWLQPLAWSEENENLVFRPTCSFKESDNEYIIQFDIPGVKKEDVKIEIQNSRLTVSGERQEDKEEKEAKHFLSETCYGAFLRSFTLPSEVDENKIDAHYEDGVLTVKVAKTVSSKAKEIKIH